MKKVWKPIKGYEGRYEISTAGEIRSFLQNHKGRLVKLHNNSRNQQIVSLTKFGDKARTMTVARLVASSFLEKPVGKNVVCHNDNNPFNNHISNLRWDTHMGNELDKLKYKTTNHGQTNGSSKLKESDVLNIHKMRLEGFSNIDIAKRYRINPKTVSAILNFRYWKYLKEVIKPKENHILVKEKPYVIEGGVFVDDRGVLKFANLFDMVGIKRFYKVNNVGLRTVRAWHGHQREGKVFLVTTGTFLIGAVDMNTGEIEKFTLSDYGNPKLLWVPPGYANGFMNLTDDNDLIIFSTSTVEESTDDDIRFPFDKWNIWKEDYR